MSEENVPFWQRLFGKRREQPIPTASAEAKQKTAEAERRAWVRYPKNVKAACKPSAASDRSWEAHVCDVSRGGIRLLVAHRFEPGSVLNVELTGKSGGASRALLVRVRYVIAQGDSRWSIGGAFPRELSEETLQAIL